MCRELHIRNLVPAQATTHEVLGTKHELSVAQAHSPSPAILSLPRGVSLHGRNKGFPHNHDLGDPCTPVFSALFTAAKARELAKHQPTDG